MASIMTSNNQFDNKMSLYIPRCDTRSLPRRVASMTQEEHEAAVAEFIGKQFRFQKVGDVDRVDVVEKKTPDGYTFYIAFVHFNEWIDCERNRELQTKILSEKERAVLQFHEKWFWICNKNNKPLAAEEVDMAKRMYMQHQQILQLQAQVAHMQQMGYLPQMYMQPMQHQMPMQFQYNPTQFPPIPGPSQLVRQTNEEFTEEERETMRDEM